MWKLQSRRLKQEHVPRMQPGDTCTITCVAADGSENHYYIYFSTSSINTGLEATDKDVLLKRVPGALQLFASAIRSGVEIALYDQYGHCVFMDKVPASDPNDADIVKDAENQERLNNVALNARSGIYIDVIQGQPYFYVFFSKNKKIASGKIMCF